MNHMPHRRSRDNEPHAPLKLTVDQIPRVWIRLGETDERSVCALVIEIGMKWHSSCIGQRQ